MTTDAMILEAARTVMAEIEPQDDWVGPLHDALTRIGVELGPEQAYAHDPTRLVTLADGREIHMDDDGAIRIRD